MQHTETDITPAANPARDRPVHPAPRIAGLDSARALAIIGMVSVHFGSPGPASHPLLATLYELPHGRASLLFVLLAGIGVSLLLKDRSAEKRFRAWVRLGIRVLVLLPLGLGLELLDIRPLVILQYYALFFLLAGPAALLPGRLLLALAAALAVLGPVAYLLLESARPEWLVRYAPATLTDPPLLIARDLLISGSYPAMVWTAPMLFGVWLGRRRLGSVSTRLRMLAGGAAVQAAALAMGAYLPDAGWWQLADTQPHSQMILWLVGSTGAAVAVLAICLMLTDRLSRLMWPLIAMGQLALTIYVAHLLLLAVAAEMFTADGIGPAVWRVSWFTAGAATFAVVWRYWLARGPLESLLYVPVQLVLNWQHASQLARQRRPASS